MIEAVFGFFALPWVPWGLSGLLILGAWLIWLQFRRRLQVVADGLDDALRVVRETAGPSAFRDHFPTIDAQLAANPVIGESWRAFAQTLVPVPGQDDAMGATRRPAEHLHEGLLTSAGVNLRFHTAVPNYLVGLGLLFTFIGLVAALYFASAGVAATNIQVAQDALRNLLAAATFKFTTSIAGLGASIAYSSREKAHLYQVGRRLSELCTALEQRLVAVTPEYLGTVQLAELKTQSTLLRRIGRNLYVTVPATVEDRLAAELIDAVQPLRAGFADAAARLGQLDTAIAARLVQPPRPASQAVGSTMAPGEGVDDRLLDELVRLREAIQALPAGLPAPLPELGTGRDADVVRALPELVTLLETSSSAIDALERRLDLALRQVRATLQELHSPPPDVASQLKASLQRLGDARRELQSLGRAFREVAASSRGMLDAHDAPGGARDPQLARALDELSHNVQRFNERVRGFMKRVDEELARSSQALTGAMSSLPKGRD